MNTCLRYSSFKKRWAELASGATRERVNCIWLRGGCAAVGGGGRRWISDFEAEAGSGGRWAVGDGRRWVRGLDKLVAEADCGGCVVSGLRWPRTAVGAVMMR